MAENRRPHGPGGGPHGPGGPHGGPRGGFGKPKDLRRTALRTVKYIASRPALLAAALVCVVVSALLGVAGTYMQKPIIDSISAALAEGRSDLPALLTSCLQLMGIYLLAAACAYVQSNLMAQLAQRGCNRLRRELFDKLQELPLSYFDAHTHGELMSRFTNDADNVQMALEQSVVQLISSVITFVGVVVMMLTLSPLLFLATVVMLGAVLAVFTVFGKRSRKYYARQQAALGAVNGNIQEMIEGMKVVKAFNHEEQAKRLFLGLNEEYRAAASEAGFYSSAIMPVAANLTNVGYAVTAVLGGILAMSGGGLSGFTLGSLVIYLQYNRQVTQPVNQISMQMTALLSAMAGAERIFAVMDAQPEADRGRVTLVPVEKDANGSLSKFSGQGRPKNWAWKVPRDCGLTLVPVSVGEGEALTELGQADREGGKLKLLPPGTDSQTGLWVRLEEDGALTPLTLEEMAAHGWAWKYPGPDGRLGLHLIRGAVRNVPGEEFCYTELRGAVRLSQVDFSYVEGKPVLKELSVYADPGQKIAFVGSTGAGKTTVTNLINRFYEIQGGLITCDGIDVKDIEKNSLRLSQGAVLQDTHLFTGTVMDNIRYGRLDATDEECVQAAKTANADGFIRRLPEGYQTMLTGDGANLSQGQRQLLSIARAAVKDPPIMVLDEATSSIDTRTEQHIQQGMDALMEGRTVFVIAHRLSTVRNADCIVVIERGQIMEKGSHAQLMAQQGRYYQLYTGQFELD
ncbi:MAG: ABC transporter ATP-binding protein [Oscillospiraceae bacterium]|nr:ABC transporter ATP-binding protein [Oscillospiraceae bacterium]